MKAQEFEQDDTTKVKRTPRNLLQFISDQPNSEEFFSLLAKYSKQLKALFVNNSTIPSEINSAIFVISLNKFSEDLVRISELCAAIETEFNTYNRNIDNSAQALLSYDSEELSRRMTSFYIEAKNYDEYFGLRKFLPKIGKTPILPIRFFCSNPFRHDEYISNEENIFKLTTAFKIHHDLFKNYLNVLYGDQKDGEDFSGNSFELISTKYKQIADTIADISKIIPDSASEKIMNGVNAKCRAVEKIIEKYPATLHLATRNLLLYFENSAPTPKNLTPIQFPHPQQVDI